jgi:hypothetical protein
MVAIVLFVEFLGRTLIAQVALDHCPEQPLVVVERLPAAERRRNLRTARQCHAGNAGVLRLRQADEVHQTAHHSFSPSAWCQINGGCPGRSAARLS